MRNRIYRTDWLKRATSLVVALALAVTVGAVGTPTGDPAEWLRALGIGVTPAPMAYAAELSSPLTTATIDGATFTLSTPSPAIPLGDGTIDYRVSVLPGMQATSMQLQLKVTSESGSLIFSRTRYLNDLSAGPGVVRTEQFTRDLSELRLRAGTYQVLCEVTVATATQRTVEELRDTLVVYDPAAEPLLFAPVLRITAPPMRDVDGTFAIDPSSAGALRRVDAASDLADWIIEDDNAAATLSISPLLVEEWLDVADGFELTGRDGAVGSGDATASRYAAALEALESAAATGRLTIAAAGFSDPNLTTLSVLGRSADVVPQYARGTSALSSALAADGSLTAPMASTVSTETVAAMASAGITLAVLPSGVAPEGPHGAVGAVGGLKVLLADADASASLSAPTTPMSALLSTLFAHSQQSATGQGAAAAIATIGDNDESTAATFTRLAQLASLPWVNLTGAREAAAMVDSATPLALADVRSSRAPWGSDESVSYITDALARSLAAHAATEEVPPAETDSTLPFSAIDAALIAEFGTATGTAGTQATAADGEDAEDSPRLRWANLARALSDETLGAITMSVRPVTLPSIDGEVPVTIVNSGATPLRITLEFVAGGGLTFTGTKDPVRITESVLLEPGETFRKPAVTLRRTSSGTLSARVIAGSYVVTEESVEVTASYIDMISTIAVVVLVGLALVAYVYSRVKRAPELADGSDGGDSNSDGT